VHKPADFVPFLSNTILRVRVSLKPGLSFARQRRDDARP
jgi:hypothetical protein